MAEFRDLGQRCLGMTHELVDGLVLSRRLPTTSARVDRRRRRSSSEGSYRPDYLVVAGVDPTHPPGFFPLVRKPGPHRQVTVEDGGWGELGDRWQDHPTGRDPLHDAWKNGIIHQVEVRFEVVLAVGPPCRLVGPACEDFQK